MNSALSCELNTSPHSDSGFTSISRSRSLTCWEAGVAETCQAIRCVFLIMWCPSPCAVHHSSRGHGRTRMPSKSSSMHLRM